MVRGRHRLVRAPMCLLACRTNEDGRRRGSFKAGLRLVRKSCLFCARKSAAFEAFEICTGVADNLGCGQDE